MKKVILPALAGFVCILVSCDNGTITASGSGKDSTQAKNLAAFDVVTKAFDTGDPGGIDNVVADDFIDHTDHGDVKGKDSLKASIIMMHKSFPDMKTETKNEAASDDYVYGWMHYSGVSDGSMGIPKGPYDMTSIELVKFADGKAVEHWAFMQPADMMKMMGPQPPDMNTGKSKTDSAATMK